MRLSTLTRIAVLARGRAVCPQCGKRLCDISPGAVATGITLWCRMCKSPVALKLGHGAEL